MEKRLIKIMGTRHKTITSSAATWGALKEELLAEDIDVSNMKGILGGSKLALEINQSELPSGDISIHLVPMKTKAGSGVETMSYGELRNAIKDVFSSNAEKANEHFNVGKNYTNKGTVELRNLLRAWNLQNHAAKTVADSHTSTTQADFKAVEVPTPQVQAKVTLANTPEEIINSEIEKLEKLNDDVLTQLEGHFEEEDDELILIDETRDAIQNTIDSLKEIKEVFQLRARGEKPTGKITKADLDEHDEIMRLFGK